MAFNFGTTARTVSDELVSYSNFETLSFKVDDFANRQELQGEHWTSASRHFAFGHWWALEVFPRGRLPPPSFSFGSSTTSTFGNGSESKANWICCDLNYFGDNPSRERRSSPPHPLEPEGIHAVLQFGGNHPILYKGFEQNTGSFSYQNSWKSEKLLLLSDLPSRCLNSDGSLTIYVHLRTCRQMDKLLTWSPKKAIQNDWSSNFGKSLMVSNVGADVTFSIGENQDNFQAHVCFLAHRAPILYNFVNDSKGNIGTVDIPDVRGTTFKMVLDNIYMNKFPDELSEEGAKDLLLTSDRFSLVNLKLHTESMIVEKYLKPANICDWLLIADGHSCPLLKEACMAVHKENTSEVIKSCGWAKILESPKLISELFLFMTTKLIPKDGSDFENMSVGMLRARLELSGLDLDGTREALVRRLKDNRAKILVSHDTTGASDNSSL